MKVITDLKQLAKTKIGDVCQYQNIKFIVKDEEEIEGFCCVYCVLFFSGKCKCFNEVVPCRQSDREDKKWVYFAEIQEEN